MARSTPTPLVPTLAGVAPAPLAPNADGDILDPGDTLVVVNGSGSPVTVTFVSTATFESADVADTGGSVPASGTRVFRVPPARLAAQASDAAVGPLKVLADYSAVASVTRWVISA